MPFKKAKNVMLIWNPKIQRSLWQLNQMAHPITADSRFWVPTAFDSLAIPKISQPLDVLFRKCSHLLKRHETALSGREIHLAATTFKYFQIKLDWKLQNHFIFPHRKCSFTQSSSTKLSRLNHQSQWKTALLQYFGFSGQKSQV